MLHTGKLSVDAARIRNYYPASHCVSELIALRILHNRAVGDDSAFQPGARTDDDRRLRNLAREAIERRKCIKENARRGLRIELVREESHLTILAATSVVNKSTTCPMGDAESTFRSGSESLTLKAS